MNDALGMNDPGPDPADRRRFQLDDRAWVEFRSLLNQPIVRKPRLERLLMGESACDE